MQNIFYKISISYTKLYIIPTAAKFNQFYLSRKSYKCSMSFNYTFPLSVNRRRIIMALEKEKDILYSN